MKVAEAHPPRPGYSCAHPINYLFLMHTQVIMDINDPADAGPGVYLYTTEFYRGLKEKLNPGFVFVTQSGMAQDRTGTEEEELVLPLSLLRKG